MKKGYPRRLSDGSTRRGRIHTTEYLWLAAATVVVFDNRSRWSSYHYAPH